MTAGAGIDTAVIGGGLVGASIVLRETLLGKNVLLIEPGAIGGGATFGNAAMIAVSEVLPMASWSNIFSTPNMLPRPGRALKIDPLYLPKLLPWLWRFGNAANRRDVDRNSALLSRLCARARDATANLLKQAQASDLLIDRDAVRVFRSRSHLEKSASAWERRARLGVQFSLVGTADLKELLPDLDVDAHVGVMVKNYHSLANPQKAAAALVAAAQERGAKVAAERVAKLEVSGKRASILTASGLVIRAGKVVVSAGAHSRGLALSVGDGIPLETERGYHVQFRKPGISLDRAYAFVDEEVAVAPIESDIRFCSFMEFAGLKKPPVKKRFGEIVAKARLLFPDLNVDSASCWMGHRPSLPDSLPVIGPSRSAENVFFCFGHGHLGVTLAAVSADILCGIMNDGRLNADFEALLPDRFL